VRCTRDLLPLDPRLLSLCSLPPLSCQRLGAGPGLTPFGDDTLLGALLALGRWGGRLTPSLNLADLSGDLLAQAAQRTTRLSVNLLACAAEGLADERLTLALDGLVCGLRRPQECAALLRAWGATSGSGVLEGFLAFAEGRLAHPPSTD
jgi:hypothetical protein